MATLLFELVRALSRAAAGEFRAQANGRTFSRSELAALATLSDLSAACCGAPALPPGNDAHDLESLERLAAFDLKIVDTARTGRAASGAG